MSKDGGIQSLAKGLRVLDLLLKHFAHGLTNVEIAKALALSPSDVTRYSQTLIDSGFAERIPETGRLRPSVRLGRAAVEILRSLDAASARIEETKSRVRG